MNIIELVERFRDIRRTYWQTVNVEHAAQQAEAKRKGRHWYGPCANEATREAYITYDTDWREACHEYIDGLAEDHPWKRLRDQIVEFELRFDDNGDLKDIVPLCPYPDPFEVEGLPGRMYGHPTDKAINKELHGAARMAAWKEWCEMSGIPAVVR